MQPRVSDPTCRRSLSDFLSFFNDPATTDIYTLSLHDALPISRTLTRGRTGPGRRRRGGRRRGTRPQPCRRPDRKSTRLNSSHMSISYAVFCLKIKITKSLIVLSFALYSDVTCLKHNT